jgi:hypothetical protein
MSGMIIISFFFGGGEKEKKGGIGMKYGGKKKEIHHS